VRENFIAEGKRLPQKGRTLISVLHREDNPEDGVDLWEEKKVNRGGEGD